MTASARRSSTSILRERSESRTTAVGGLESDVLDVLAVSAAVAVEADLSSRAGAGARGPGPMTEATPSEVVRGGAARDGGRSSTDEPAGRFGEPGGRGPPPPASTEPADAPCEAVDVSVEKEEVVDSDDDVLPVDVVSLLDVDDELDVGDESVEELVDVGSPTGSEAELAQPTPPKSSLVVFATGVWLAGFSPPATSRAPQGIVAAAP